MTRFKDLLKAYESEHEISAVGFTGHRPKQLYGYSESAYRPFTTQLLRLLTVLIGEGARTFISGGAQGGDMLFFDAVEELKTRKPEIRNVIYIPFYGQDSRWLDTGAFSRRDYKLMLSGADAVREISPVKTMQAYHTRNQSIVNNSDIMIALVSRGKQPGTIEAWQHDSSGTCRTMRYARANGKMILPIDRDGTIYDPIPPEE